MTEQEIAHDRAEVRAAIYDPRHPWHFSATALLRTYAIGDEAVRTFLKAIAPYCFTEEGQPLQKGKP